MFEELYIKSMQYAQEKHGDQSYGKESYMVHLLHTVNIATKYKLPDDIIMAAWLHDILEDTDITKEELKEKFGETICKYVEGVTNEPGKNRKERNRKTYPKIRKDPLIVALKLCDRIANVSNCVKEGSTLLNMYKKEYAEFREALYKEGEWVDMWKELDELLKK